MGFPHRYIKTRILPPPSFGGYVFLLCLLPRLPGRQFFPAGQTVSPGPLGPRSLVAPFYWTGLEGLVYTTGGRAARGGAGAHP